QPVLLEARERSQTGIRRVGLTAALFVVEVRATTRAKAPAVASANDLHGQSQNHLLSQNIRQKEPLSFKKSNLGIVFFEPRLFRLQAFGQRAVEQVEAAIHFLDDGIQTACAHQLDLSFDFSGDTDLPL